MKTPHEHAAVIKAWADGEEPQYKSKIDGEWYSTLNPMFEPDWEWRIKPEPKPDYKDTMSVYRNLNYRFENERLKNTYNLGLAPDYIGDLKLTFDGETGKLKEAVVL